LAGKVRFFLREGEIFFRKSSDFFICVCRTKHDWHFLIENLKLFCTFAGKITYAFMKENLEIPTGTNKEDIKEREKIINDI